MTTYFDSMHERIREAGKSPWTNQDPVTGLYPLDAAEALLVFDCTVAAMMPGFPEDLRKAIHETVLRHGISSIPPNAIPRRDPEDAAQQASILNDLCFDLHSIFHALAGRGLPNFNDGPLTPLRALYCQGEEERGKMVPEAQRNLPWEKAEAAMLAEEAPLGTLVEDKRQRWCKCGDDSRPGPHGAAECMNQPMG